MRSAHMAGFVLFVQINVLLVMAYVVADSIIAGRIDLFMISLCVMLGALGAFYQVLVEAVTARNGSNKQ